MQITEVFGLEGEVITTNDLAAYEFLHEDANGRLVGRYKSPQSLPKFMTRLAYYGLDKAWTDTMGAV